MVYVEERENVYSTESFLLMFCIRRIKALVKKQTYKDYSLSLHTRFLNWNLNCGSEEFRDRSAKFWSQV